MAACWSHCPLQARAPRRAGARSLPAGGCSIWAHPEAYRYAAGISLPDSDNRGVNSARVLNPQAASL